MKSVLVALVCFCVFSKGEDKLREIFRWKTIDYKFPNVEARNLAIENGEFIPENNEPFGVEVWKDKVFVTLPRRKPGIPATLTYFSLYSNYSSPLLIPYPDWETNILSSRFFISTYRARADSCDRLWTVDTGYIIDAQGVTQNLSPPRIRVFNLKTNNLLLEYTMKASDYICDSSHTNIVVDVGASCDDTYAYAVDATAASLFVYSLQDNVSWRIQHPYFLPHPLHSDYNVGNIRFSWTDGIFGLALTEPNVYGFRNAFAHPMSSVYEIITTTQKLRNQTIWTNAKDTFEAVQIIGSREETFQAATSAYDEKSGVLFYSLVQKNAIACWNSRKHAYYSSGVNDLVASIDEPTTYFTDIKVDSNSNVWAITNKIDLILNAARLNPALYNFRIFWAKAQTLIKGTECDQNKQFYTRTVWGRGEY